MADSSDEELSSVPSELNDLTHKSSARVTASKKTKKTEIKSTAASSRHKKRSLDDDADVATKVAKKSRTQKATGKATKAETEELTEEIVGARPKKATRTTKKAKTEVVSKKELKSENGGATDGIEVDSKATPTTSRKGRKATVKKVETKEESDVDEEGTTVQKVTKKRKTKEEKEAEAMPLIARTLGQKMFVGAHVSSAGGTFCLDTYDIYSFRLVDILSTKSLPGVHNSVTNAVHIGGNAFALFLKSQRKWENPALKDEHLDAFHAHCKNHTYDQAQHVLPHGSYLVNLAHADSARSTQAYDSFLDDLQRCEKLGIKLYNFHPGNTNGNPHSEAIARLASNINNAHEATSSVITVLETMAAGGNVIGSTFEDLRDTIALISNKERVGVCLDTAHVFAAGYDIRTPDVFKETLQKFDDVIGIKYLKALHLNDSKAPLNSNRDLHFNIGLGFLGLRTFHSIMNEPRLHGMPLVLETPITKLDDDGNVVKDVKGKEIEDKNIWAQEIKLLESLVGMDTESEEFKTLDADLQRKGAKERKRVQEQVDKRVEKGEKGKGKSRGRRGKKNEASESEDDDE
ncbi:MAG: hypothetical protein M1821_002257 [Bathelium mastoideum]|nr:MAG: hypothetical protein M1821_002257 [Bathelium mastoideum]